MREFWRTQHVPSGDVKIAPRLPTATQRLPPKVTPFKTWSEPEASWIQFVASVELKTPPCHPPTAINLPPLKATAFNGLRAVKDYASATGPRRRPVRKRTSEAGQARRRREGATARG